MHAALAESDAGHAGTPQARSAADEGRTLFGKIALPLAVVPWAVVAMLIVFRPPVGGIMDWAGMIAGFGSIPLALALGVAGLFGDGRKALAIAATVLAVANGPMLFWAAQAFE
ncbi:MAG: hypothetical protein R6X20_11810 [Phycisphaerae bacterium]